MRLGTVSLGLLLLAGCPGFGSEEGAECYTFVEIIAQYRINIEPSSRSKTNNEALLQVHGWY